MNRLKLLATATLVALAFTACDEGTPPPVEPPPPPTPVGTISGSVTIEGTAAAGITATLSSGATTTTGSGGNFAFSGVEAGTYTVTISGFPEDATFAQVTQSATIASEGQNVQLNFAGEYIRSSSVVGSVTAADAMMSGGDGQPETLVGVTVTLGGEHAMGETMETGMDGGFMPSPGSARAPTRSRSATSRRTSPSRRSASRSRSTWARSATPTSRATTSAPPRSRAR